MDKIYEEEKYDEFYAVATNLDASVAVTQNRYKIEDYFRIMKTNFDARSVLLRKPERIRTHSLICYTVLLMYRFMECKLDDMYYKSVYRGNQALNTLKKCFELQLNRKYYRPSDLNKTVKKS